MTHSHQQALPLQASMANRQPRPLIDLRQLRQGFERRLEAWAQLAEARWKQMDLRSRYY